MYEKFTDRARKVMQMANQEAQRFQHEYIGTEHILLALIAEGSGVAANVLLILGIELRKVRREIEKIVAVGPDMVTMGKLPQTPRAKRVIEFAIDEARQLKHDFIGTEHLLLGLLREEEGLAAQVLMNLDLRLSDVRQEVLNLLGYATGIPKLPEPNVVVDPELQHLPPCARAIVEEFDRQIWMLTEDKEHSVARQEWEKAAQFRDWGHMLK